MTKTYKKIKVLFIVNPFSGVGRQKAFEKHLENNLDHQKFDYKLVYTEAPNHATQICEQGVSEGFNLIVAVGGDGTVNEVAKPLVGKKVPMGIVPSGSGNGLARHLKIPMEPEKAIHVINRFKTKWIDTVDINDQFFVSIAGVGFDAFVARKFANQKRRGFFKYAQIAITEYFAYRPRKYSLVIDGKKVEHRALFISLANSDQFGYNTSISPHAKIDDGMIDICIMKKVPFWKTIFLAPLLFTKNIDKSRYIEIIRANEFDLIQKKKRINLDGESVKMSRKLHIKVVPGSLNVVVPE